MIARALMHRPKVMFLDEPTTGLDPQARLFVHDMDEAAKLSDRVGIIDHGKLLALDTPADLMRGLSGSTTLTVTVNLNDRDASQVSDRLSTVDGVERVEQISTAPGAGDRYGQFRLYTTYEPAAVLPSVLKVLGDIGCDLTDLAIGTPSLEDVFINLTGRELR